MNILSHNPLRKHLTLEKENKDVSKHKASPEIVNSYACAVRDIPSVGWKSGCATSEPMD